MSKYSKHDAMTPVSPMRAVPVLGAQRPAHRAISLALSVCAVGYCGLSLQGEAEDCSRISLVFFKPAVGTYLRGASGGTTLTKPEIVCFYRAFGSFVSAPSLAPVVLFIFPCPTWA